MTTDQVKKRDHLQGMIWRRFPPGVDEEERICPVCELRYHDVQWHQVHYMSVIIDGNIVQYKKVHDVVHLCSSACVDTFLSERQFQGLAF